LARALTT